MICDGSLFFEDTNAIASNCCVRRDKLMFAEGGFIVLLVLCQLIDALSRVTLLVSLPKINVQ